MTKIKLTGLEIESESNGAATHLLLEGLTMVVRRLGEAIEPGTLLPPPERTAFIPSALPAPATVAPGVATAVPPAAQEATVESLQAETPPQLEELQELFRGRRRGRRKPAEPATTRPGRSGKAQRLVIGTTMEGKETKPMTPKEAASLAGARQSTLMQACAPSMRGRSCGGYTWRWADSATATDGGPTQSRRSRRPRAAKRAAARPSALPTPDAGRTLRKGAKLVIWDKKPHTPLTMKEAAEIARVTPSAVTLAVKQGRPVKGFMFTEHAPVSNAPRQTQLTVGSAERPTSKGDRTTRNENPRLVISDEHQPAVSTKPVHVPEAYEQERAGRPRLSTDEAGKALPLNPNRVGSGDRPPMPDAIARKYSSREAAMSDAAAALLEDDE